MQVLTVYGTLLASLLAQPQSPGGDSAGLFPAIDGWKLAPPPGDSVYTRENLWDIIDGAADVFLSYGFVDLHIGEYTSSGGDDVRAELYRHKSRDDAFGMYSQERSPAYHFIDVGTQGYIEGQVLNFLCGVYYVKLSSHSRGEKAQDALILIARALDGHLRQDRGWPAECAFFPPSEGRRPNADTYVAENFLGYRALHSAYVAQYEEGYKLFLIDCDSPEKAREMVSAYVKAAGMNESLLVKEGKLLEVVDPHNGPVYLRLEGGHILGDIGLRYVASDDILRRFQDRISLVQTH